jgi:hypothetical protein
MRETIADSRVIQSKHRHPDRLPGWIAGAKLPLERGMNKARRGISRLGELNAKLSANAQRSSAVLVGGVLGYLASAPALAPMRQALAAIGSRRESAPPAPAALIPPVDRARLGAEVAALRELGRTPDGKQIRVGRLAAGSLLLREIGRLREASFRAVGEGTGRAFDVDAYDAWYEHIVLWDAEASAIAGAYRVCRGAEVLARRGLPGLYTASLFEFGPAALARIAEGMELGRSFVAPEYWNSRSLDYLWLGIGAYLRAHPEVRYLFGPVSISAALPITAREHLVAYYGQHFGTPGLFDAGQSGSRAVRPRHPFRFLAAMPCYRGSDAGQGYARLKAELAALEARVPVLYKQYTELCEPGGARFLAFGVDPDFANCVDGLIEVDLQRITPAKARRYLATAAGSEVSA